MYRDDTINRFSNIGDQVMLATFPYMIAVRAIEKSVTNAIFIKIPQIFEGVSYNL